MAKRKISIRFEIKATHISGGTVKLIVVATSAIKALKKGIKRAPWINTKNCVRVRLKQVRQSDGDQSNLDQP